MNSVGLGPCLGLRLATDEDDDVKLSGVLPRLEDDFLLRSNGLCCEMAAEVDVAIGCCVAGSGLTEVGRGIADVLLRYASEVACCCILLLY